MERELIEHIARNLVNDPASVRVKQRRAGSATVLELHVAPDDMGRVIGKNGRVANAMRSLLRVVNSHKSGRVILEID
jgi:predicted RNA-binding protein YlqC (UPF0109 family)